MEVEGDYFSSIMRSVTYDEHDAAAIARQRILSSFEEHDLTPYPAVWPLPHVELLGSAWFRQALGSDLDDEEFAEYEAALNLAAATPGAHALEQVRSQSKLRRQRAKAAEEAQAQAAKDKAREAQRPKEREAKKPLIKVAMPPAMAPPASEPAEKAALPFDFISKLASDMVATVISEAVMGLKDAEPSKTPEKAPADVDSSMVPTGDAVSAILDEIVERIANEPEEASQGDGAEHDSEPEGTDDEEADGSEEAAAATRVQASIRGRQVRAKKAAETVEAAVAEGEEEGAGADEVAAATRVQAGIRGRQVRAKKAADNEALTAAEAEETTAAARVQAGVRGRKVRKNKAAEADAAIRVQASARGRQSRAKHAADKARAATAAQEVEGAAEKHEDEDEEEGEEEEGEEEWEEGEEELDTYEMTEAEAEAAVAELEAAVAAAEAEDAAAAAAAKVEGQGSSGVKRKQ